MCKINGRSTAEGVLNENLRGAQLDCFRVYSIELGLCFLVDVEAGRKKETVWISTMSVVQISDTVGNDGLGVPTGNNNFMETRAVAVSMLHRLIGQRVKSIEIKENGTLEIYFGKKNVSIAGGDKTFEVIWSVTSGSPEPFGEHDWSVTLADEGIIVTDIAQ